MGDRAAINHNLAPDQQEGEDLTERMGFSFLGATKDEAQRSRLDVQYYSCLKNKIYTSLACKVTQFFCVSIPGSTTSPGQIQLKCEFQSRIKL